MNGPERTVAILNQKGGVGKTTTAVHFAHALALSGRRVLLVDLDPQANATLWIGRTDAPAAQVSDALRTPRDVAASVGPSVLPGVDLMYGSQETTLLERELQQSPAPVTALRRALRTLEVPYNVAVIDCGPSLGTLVLNAICAADEVLIPVEAHSLALAGLGQVRQTLLELADAEVLDHTLPTRVLITRYDGRTGLARDVATYLRSESGADVLPTIIHTSTKLAESFGARQTIFTYAPRDRGAADYIGATTDFLAPIGAAAP